MRVLPGLLLVLFLPGYSLIAALFPRRGDPDGIERIALSFGMSIAVVSLIGLGLNYTPFGIRLVPVLAGLSVFTILLALALVCAAGAGFRGRSGLWSRDGGWGVVEAGGAAAGAKAGEVGWREGVWCGGVAGGAAGGAG